MSQAKLQHPMEQLAQENMLKFLALLIWKFRLELKGLEVEITLKDMQSLAAACASALKTPVVMFHGKRDSVVLRLVDQSSGQLIKLQEPNEAALAAEMRVLLDARDEAQTLVPKLLAPVQMRDRAAIDLERAEAARLLSILSKK